MEESTTIKLLILKKPQEGIKEVRYIDPMKIKLVRKIKKDAKTAINPSFSVSGTQNGTGSFATPEVEEFYEYNPNTRGSAINTSQYKIGNGRGSKNCKGCDYLCTLWSCRQKQASSSFLSPQSNQGTQSTQND